MGDVERITTTERHAELRNELAEIIARKMWGTNVEAGSEDAAEAVLSFIERERRKRLIAILTGMEFSEEELADVLAVFDD